MLLVTSVYGVTILTIVGTKFSIVVEPNIFIFLIWKSYFPETYVLGVTQFATERASDSRITTCTSMINACNKQITFQLTFLLSH